jgi:hypothetical protein
VQNLLCWKHKSKRAKYGTNLKFIEDVEIEYALVSGLYCTEYDSGVGNDEIEHNSPKVAEYDEETSRKALEDDVDALDEARDEVLS